MKQLHPGDCNALRELAVDTLTRAAGTTHFPEWLADTLAVVAANVGGIEQLVSSASDGHSAEDLRRLAGAAATDEDAILGRRTTPVIIPLNIPDILDSQERLVHRRPDTLAERDRYVRIDAARKGITIEKWWSAHRGEVWPKFAIWVPAVPPSQTYERQRDLATDALELNRLRDEWERRYCRYANHFRAAVQTEGARIGLRVPVVLDTICDPDRARTAPDNPDGRGDQIVARLWEHGRATTPPDLLTTDAPPARQF